MRTRFAWLAVAAMMPQAPLRALTPPSASDGPLRLLGCTVTNRGILQAQVDNQSDDALFCDIRCGYELGGKMFSHEFSATIPKRFQGSIGEFETHGAREGTYRGEVGRCSRV